MFDPVLLRTFVTVAETLNFTVTGQLLGLRSADGEPASKKPLRWRAHGSSCCVATRVGFA
jgi:hypothetical protein